MRTLTIPGKSDILSLFRSELGWDSGARPPGPRPSGARSPDPQPNWPKGPWPPGGQRGRLRSPHLSLHHTERNRVADQHHFKDYREFWMLWGKRRKDFNVFICATFLNRSEVRLGRKRVREHTHFDLSQPSALVETKVSADERGCRITAAYSGSDPGSAPRLQNHQREEPVGIWSRAGT